MGEVAMSRILGRLNKISFPQSLEARLYTNLVTSEREVF